MLSMPPATIRSASPARMAWAASTTAFNPEPHTLLTVKAAMVSGKPALSAAWRAGFWPTPACSTCPMMTSSTRSLATPARRMASAMAMAPSRGAGMSPKAPRYLPIGVRAADRMKASAIRLSSCLALRACMLIINYKPAGWQWSLDGRIAQRS